MDIESKHIGRKFNQAVEILKVKNGKVTLISINDVCYRLDVAATEKEKKRHSLTIEERRKRLQQMGRIRRNGDGTSAR